uniref:Uncharacterized protein n=1 Tax=Sipha flava TaxID=143950 RepID=A0A2S2Q1G5_9HEMI
MSYTMHLNWFRIFESNMSLHTLKIGLTYYLLHHIPVQIKIHNQFHISLDHYKSNQPSFSCQIMYFHKFKKALIYIVLFINKSYTKSNLSSNRYISSFIIR